jgi:anti-sigma factor RsiW
MQHVDEGRLHAWLDGELPDEERAVERHLEDCDACRARADEERRIRSAASSILLGADPGEIAMRRMVAVPAARRPRPWVAVGWAASVLLALGVGWMARPSPREPIAIAPAPRSAPVSTPTATDLSTAPAPVPVEPTSDAAPPEETATQTAPAAKVAAAPREQSDSPPVAEPIAPAEMMPLPEAMPPAPPPPPPAPAAGTGTYALEALPASPPPVARRRAEAAEPPPPSAPLPSPVEIAAETVTLRGRVVRSENGEGLSGAQISVPAVAARTVTRADGSYDLTIPAERLAGRDTIRVHASVIGREAQSRVHPAESGTANFAMPGSAIALEGVAVTGGSGSWRASAQAEAERYLRHRLVIVPGLQVLGIEVGRVDGRTAVRVRQRLPGGETLSLTQRRTTARADTTGQGVTIRRGGLLVEATAPIPADSIRSLF